MKYKGGFPLEYYKYSISVLIMGLYYHMKKL